MGIIRKTASIGTLGMINFRSKKEKLRRAERAAGEALSARDAEHLAREVAESGFAKVETELRRLTKSEAKAAKQLSRLRRNRKVRRAERLSNVLAAASPVIKAATPVVKDGVETARHGVKDLAKEGAKHGRRARKAAQKASHQVRVGAEKALDDARSAMQH